MYKRTTILSARLLSTCMASLFMIPSCSSNEPQYPEINNKDNNNKEKKTILTEADPTIIRDTDGTYYLYGTGAQSDKGFYVYSRRISRNGLDLLARKTAFASRATLRSEPQVFGRHK